MIETREQIARDVERFRGYDGPTTILAHHCLALLAELEQAEKEKDNATDAWQLEIKRALAAEARLAKVPALVEALKTITHTGSALPHARRLDRERMSQIASEALAGWDQTL